METPEQYTMKTLEEVKEQVAKKNGFNDWVDLQQTWLERVGRKLVVHENYIDQVAKLWNAELIKENERLSGDFLVQGASLIRVKAENERLKAELDKLKFQPKKDESIEQRG